MDPIKSGLMKVDPRKLVKRMQKKKTLPTNLILIKLSCWIKSTSSLKTKVTNRFNSLMCEARASKTEIFQDLLALRLEIPKMRTRHLNHQKRSLKP